MAENAKNFTVKPFPRIRKATIEGIDLFNHFLISHSFRLNSVYLFLFRKHCEFRKHISNN
jgi:hypothetical protein